MTDDYEFKERVSIKMDSGIDERQAIAQAKRELEQPECIARLNKLQEQMRMDRAEKKLKQSRRYSYDPD